MIEKFNKTTDRSQAIDIATLINEKEWKLPSDLQFNSEKFTEAITYIDATLKSGNPLVIGVHYTNTHNGAYNSNKATFHYMVLVGKYYKNKKEYYRFNDPGRTSEANGKAETNLLEIDKTNNKISCTYNGKTYTITEVRKNK